LIGIAEVALTMGGQRQIRQIMNEVMIAIMTRTKVAIVHLQMYIT